MESLTLKHVDAKHPHLWLLIDKLDEELLQRYPAEDIFGLDREDPRLDQSVFVVAYDGDRPVGCGGIRPLDAESTELKRFFVERDYRKRGAAGRMLAFLEERARERNFASVKLETGPEQPESLHFYKKHGYAEIDRYGEYIGSEASICFEKRLADGPAQSAQAPAG
ncbi:GNAT family N-acetyltransferase [Paenibacillus sp. UNC499MF]|uniref:GNAT family N-acetyltransferase n=1 Tax=Paenibacillus sp. UNC499MF TaxID=1502751 RepID=UPI000CDF1953|nr:GNAT family N-acetyltransferase [Paenibacillus sp. UNC499MF]